MFINVSQCINLNARVHVYKKSLEWSQLMTVLLMQLLPENKLQLIFLQIESVRQIITIFLQQFENLITNYHQLKNKRN